MKKNIFSFVISIVVFLGIGRILPIASVYAVDCQWSYTGSNFTVIAAADGCRFPSPSDGVETGEGLINDATLKIPSGKTVTILQPDGSPQSITVGQLSLEGGSVIIPDGSSIILGAGLWLPDLDDDGYAASGNPIVSRTQPAGYIRRNALTHLEVDCDDTDPNKNVTCVVPTTSPTPTSYPQIGLGGDSACTVSSGTTDLNTGSCSGRGTADAVNFTSTANTAAGSSSITLSSTPTGLSVGDEVLIINLQGTTSDYANVGKYETHQITSIDSNTLGLDSALTNSYDGTTQKIMVQRIPQYTTVTVSSGATLTASAWNRTKGGVLFFRATDLVTVIGSITMTAKGYYGGGAIVNGANDAYGVAGESYCNGSADGIHIGGRSSNYYIANSAGVCSGGGGGGTAGAVSSSGSAGSNVGGGGGAAGGGGAHVCGTSCRPSGGGGGGYGTIGYGGTILRGPGTAGANGNGTTSGAGGNYGFDGVYYTGGGGGGGGTYGTEDLSTLFFGSGGGTGGAGWSNGGPTGGNGGGIIVIYANSVSITGSIQSNGGAGGAGDCYNEYPSNSAGSGAGGSIKIVADTIGNENLVTATPGSVTCQGGSGGSGRIVTDTLDPPPNPTPTPLATGGTVTTSGNYTIHTFTSNGTFTPGASMNVEVLVVAGGGGGGYAYNGEGVNGMGGGGGGGIIYNASYPVTAQAYSVTVGSGGAKGNNSSHTQGYNGGNSVFSGLTATGGGGGGGINSRTGVNGGCGGGGAASGSSAGGTGSQGYNGGSGLYNGTIGTGGGGGGMGGVGASPGTGGAGYQSDISGTALYYGAGGGGGTWSGTTNYAGGSGIGGRGASQTGASTAGTANRGAGGGGGATVSYPSGANGSSGIVIIRYALPTPTPTNTPTPTVTPIPTLTPTPTPS